ncbi:methyltransferase domain-containing protein [Candidatus Cyanaurora vandensis]|uniref:methyltransferase domain-containing protein n=1 Tax=Candidatus Cyanaurora vandensis TaxID=2714958 RepID=UPI00257DEFE6|nr:methyltransferase domain-containing protein [Candidatus Cyanaurora vandensis]
MATQTPTALRQDIRAFYDSSSALWESVWGEHMHHGYWDSPAPKDRRQAQVDLIVELLRWSGVTKAQRILDVGCGIGGRSLYLAEQLQAQVTGITLSPVQAQRAQARAQAAGLATQTQFEVADALALPYPDASFDLVWALESGEHMADKARFLSECWRVLQPGGRLVMATWCCAPGPLTPQQNRQLAKIYQVYYLPYILSIPAYETILTELGYQGIQTTDWSAQVSQFWQLVMDSAQLPAVIREIRSLGWPLIRAALAMGLMREGYRTGLIRYGVFTAVRG